MAQEGIREGHREILYLGECYEYEKGLIHGIT